MRRVLRWVGRVFAVGLVLFGVRFCLLLVDRHGTRAAGEARLASVEAELDRTDPGWRIDDLLAARSAAVPPDDRNLTKLCVDLTADWPADYKRWEVESGDWLTRPDLNRQPPEEAVAAARAAFVGMTARVRRARAAGDWPAGGWRLPSRDNPLTIPLEHIQRVRQVAGLLRTDAVLAALDRDGQRAAEAVASCLHLVRAVGDEPVTISQLVRIAVASSAVQATEQTLAWDKLPAAALARLTADMLAEAEVPRMTYAFRGERAIAQGVFVGVDTGRISLAELAESSPNVWRDAPARWQYRPDLPADQADYLEYITDLLSAMKLPPHARAVAIAGIDPPPREFKHLLSGLLRPPVERFLGHDDRIVARLRSAAVGLACERFRQTNGRWPADLAELKALVPAIPLDPYDGEPLRYRKLDDGVVVYAVGPDRTDDDGNLSYGNPQPGEDVGFRLWDVAARRRPPEDAP